MHQNTLLNTIALLVLIIATALSHYWVWGVLFIFWALQSARTGSAFLLTPIQRRDAPLLFWAITALWMLFGILYVLPPSVLSFS